MRGLGNVVVLTGDEHQNFAGLLHDGDGPVGGGVRRDLDLERRRRPDLRPGSDRILANNPQLKFINDQRGYLTCEVGPDEWRTNYMVMDRVSTPGGAIEQAGDRWRWRAARALRDVDRSRHSDLIRHSSEGWNPSWQ